MLPVSGDSPMSPPSQVSYQPGLPDDAGSPAAAAGLGILARHGSVPPRVPVGSKAAKASPPETPYQPRHNGFAAISSPMSSAAASPLTGFRGAEARPSTVFARLRDAVVPRKKKPSREAEPLRRNAAPTPAPLTPDDAKGAAGHETSTVASDVEADAAGGDGDEDDDDEFDDDMFKKKFAEPPTYCWSREDIVVRRNHWLSVVVIGLSVYSTVMSAIWLVVAVVQPRWDHSISSRGGLQPSTSTLVAALAAKTIELSFVTVFISCLGQVLTRRALARRSQGMTLADMTMRNWVLQPGSLMTHFETLPYAGLSLLGALSLTATMAAMLYTTASDAMVAPKLKYGGWQSRELTGLVRSSYANAKYVGHTCPSLLAATDAVSAPDSCTNVKFSGQSYRNLLAFMATWTEMQTNGSGTALVEDLAQRPAGTTLLYDNTTMAGAWIETEHANVTRHFEERGRIVNNVTMAMPHPGVYAAARLPVNGILQPDELGGVGEYAIRAGVVSPSIGVMCVAMRPSELAPLVYTSWPHSRTNRTGVGSQTIGVKDIWIHDVPAYGDAEYLNRTVVDDIFRWGPKYGRRPPVFQLYPADYNIVFNATYGPKSDAIYLLGKTFNLDNYTLCEIRSWVSPSCSTHFNISGTGGASMRAHCEDDNDRDAYRHSIEGDAGWDHQWAPPSTDWKWLAEQWRLSMDLNGGTYNNNASNARILTLLALSEPKLPIYLPSMAEALAVFASSMLVIGSIDTPFRHYWDVAAPNGILGEPGLPRMFNASLMTQQYTSGHVNSWQGIFYVVLAHVFVINVCCLVYLGLRSGMVTDFTEPQNLFALAINSPPSAQLKGSCGAGPRDRDLVVPWRVAYANESNHYFFQEANERPWRGKYSKQGVTTARDHVDIRRSSYKRLSSGRSWL